MMAKVFTGGRLVDACGNRGHEARLAQIKVDGWRATLESDNPILCGRGSLLGRYAGKLPAGCLFDGELVGDQYHAFDLLFLHGVDISERPQIERLQLLDTIEGDFHHVRWSIDVARLARYAYDEGLEGIVTKLAHQPYGKGCWVKWKKHVTLDVQVVAVSKWKRTAEVLMDGQPAGKVMSVPPTVAVGDVIEVRAMEITKAGKLRHGVFVRARPDKAVTPARPSPHHGTPS